MKLRQAASRFYYSFPIQLVVMHIKKNQIMMLYWVLLFGFITESIATRFGVPYLFLDPEYMGRVGLRAFFIMGFSIGAFIMAFNISSFILNSFRFPFLATLSRTFFKYAHNNFIIPLSFVLLYTYRIYEFQHINQLKETPAILLNIAMFWAGIILVIFLTLRYFMVTNKDIFKLFGVEHADDDQTSAIRPSTANAKRRTWRVDTYIVGLGRLKLVRDTRHYQKYMLEQVFQQNHVNAAVIEMVVFVTFIILGLFRDYTIFRIPAGASVLLLFTMLIMLSGVFRYWLRAWANTAIVGVFILLNFLSHFEVFNPRNQAYGLNYNKGHAAYTREALTNQINDSIYQHDVQHTIAILERWKARWAAQGVEKPKMILLNVSGGGLRSCVFTFRTLQMLDSTFYGQLMHHTSLICGSSGGMISASYYRELFLSYHDSLEYANQHQGKKYQLNIGKDLLNSTGFSAVVADLFLNMQRFKYGNYYYVKDRAYAWEEQLNENTGGVFNKPLSAYREPEERADIPMLIISPTIINDGRALQISPQPISYMLHDYTERDSGYKAIPNGVEFSRYFATEDAANLRFSSALRMNSAFPYIMPAVSLPSEPAMEVMDAGIRDNFGVMNSTQFLYTFRDWIAENTSGVIFLQIRDTHKNLPVEDNSIKTIVEKLTSPMRNVSGNFIIMQDYNLDRYLETTEGWFKGPVDFITFQMPESTERASLSWHLTEREKKFLDKAVLSPENTVQLNRLIQLIKSQEAVEAKK